MVISDGDLASTKFRFSPAHVLFGKLRPYLAKVATVDFAGVCSTDILPILPGRKIERRFLRYFLLQPEVVARTAALATGANLPRLSPSSLEQFLIPLAPLPEQHRIANVLDRTDALRAKRRQTIGQLNALAYSVFLDMFGDPVSNPMGWPEGLSLGQVAHIVSGVTKGRKPRGSITRQVPYLAVANVQDRHLDLGHVKTIEATEAEVARYRLQIGDLLLTEGGDPDKLGRGSLWDEQIPECIHQNHVFRVRLLDGRFTPMYVNWLVGSERGKRYFLRSAKQTTGIASINLTQLRAFPLVVPPLALQVSFSRTIQHLTQQLELAERSALEMVALFHSLQLRAFRGEL